MAESGHVSDAQALLQSMLQRLRLQTQPERIIITKDQEYFQFTECDDTLVASPTEKATHSFRNSMSSKEQERTQSFWTNTDAQWIVQQDVIDATKDSKVNHSGISSPKIKPLVRWSMNNRSAAERKSNAISEVPKWDRKQLKFSLRGENEKNISPLPTKENHVDIPDLSALSPASEEQGQNGVGSGEVKSDIIVVPEKKTQTRTSRRKLADRRQKRWTEKVKERWKDHQKKNGEARKMSDSEKQEEAKNGNSPDPTQTSESNPTMVLYENVEVQHQSINSVADEAPPGPLDQMSDTLFSFGSFNLMEEIFTGEEWAKFLTPGPDVPVSSCNTQTTDSASSISPACQEDRTTIGQWDLKKEIDSILKFPPSQTSDENVLQNMDTTPDLTLAWKHTTGSPVTQLELLDLGTNQFQNMGLSVNRAQENKPTEEHSMDLNLNNHSEGIEANLLQSQSNDQHLSQSKVSDLNHVQSESGKEEFLPLLDLSYLQPQDGSSEKKQGSLGRKRGHCTVTRSSSQLGGTESGEVDEFRDAVVSSYSLPFPNLSPSSSISSLQHSISQDSESSTETLVKKRRVESTRRVRFAEEVVIFPAPVWSEDEDAKEDDNYLHFDDDKDDEDGESDEDDEDCQEQPSPLRPSVPSWLMALRSRTKRKSRVKLPPLLSPPMKSKTLKKFTFGNSTS